MVPAPWAREAAAALPRRGRRRAPHPQRRARRLPVGADHPRAVAARRRRRLPPHARRPVGPRRPRRGAARVPGPDRAGHPVGLRREPPHVAPERADDATRVLRHLPRARRRVPPPACACRPSPTSTTPASRSGALAAEEGVVFPDHFVPARKRRQPGARRAGAGRPRAGRHRDPRAARRRHARGPGAVAELAGAWVDDLELVTSDASAARAARPCRGRRSSASATLRDAMHAPGSGTDAGAATSPG